MFGFNYSKLLCENRLKAYIRLLLVLLTFLYFQVIHQLENSWRLGEKYCLCLPCSYSSLCVCFGCSSRENTGLCDLLYGARQLTLNLNACRPQNAKDDRVCLQQLLCHNKSMRRILCRCHAGHRAVEQKVAGFIITEMISE